jgi:hypothetical protein
MKVWYYIVILTGLMIFLHIAGLPSGASPVFNLVGISFSQNNTIQNVSMSAGGFYNTIFSTETGNKGFLILAIGAGIVVGFLTKQSTENFILLGFSTGIGVLYAGTLFGLITYVVSLGDTFTSTLLVLILTPLTIGYLFSLAEFFRGTD